MALRQARILMAEYTGECPNRSSLLRPFRALLAVPARRIMIFLCKRCLLFSTDYNAAEQGTDSTNLLTKVAVQHPILNNAVSGGVLGRHAGC